MFKASQETSSERSAKGQPEKSPVVCLSVQNSEKAVQVCVCNDSGFAMGLMWMVCEVPWAEGWGQERPPLAA